MYLPTSCKKPRNHKNTPYKFNFKIKPTMKAIPVYK